MISVNEKTRHHNDLTIPLWVQLLTYVGMVAALALLELPVWFDAEQRATRLNGWLGGLEPDGLPFLPFVILFPVCWFGFQSSRGGRSSKNVLIDFLSESPRSSRPSLSAALLLAALVFVLALFMSTRLGWEFVGLPPAFHDEYSYSLQAELFATGRWSAPGFSEAPNLFDQMHVLNEGKFTSRYFPGTAIWMAPFAAIDHVLLGHQIAQAISAMMIFWIGRELANSGVGLLAGGLFALSPGLILFSNLLLAHHPTLVGLTFFLWSFLRMMRTSSLLNALLAGLGLAFAMLCRPMTAAGFALPFGIVFIWSWCKDVKRELAAEDFSLGWFAGVSRNVIAMAIPLLLGFAILGVQNLAITGAVTKTPYSIYNDIYTPRHVYGFNNAVRGDRPSGPLVSDRYDRWAANLTPDLAVENARQRFVQSWRWTLGVLPLLLVSIIYLFTMRTGDWRWRLIGASILSLHIVHIPYWFSGIMGWHYVFETAPLWLLIFAEVSRRLFVSWQVAGRWMMKYCWLLFIGTAISVNLLTFEPVWPARLEKGAVEIKYPRQLYSNFRRQIEEFRAGQPVIVFVVPDRDDISMDYVTNFPDWQQDVLVARVADRSAIEQQAALFPKRKVIVFDAKKRIFDEL